MIVNRSNCSFCLLILFNWKNYLKGEKNRLFLFFSYNIFIFRVNSLLNLKNNILSYQRIKLYKKHSLISIFNSHIWTKLTKKETQLLYCDSLYGPSSHTCMRNSTFSFRMKFKCIKWFLHLKLSFNQFF